MTESHPSYSEGDSQLDEKILRQLFLQRLPANIQAVLAGTVDNVSLDQTADMADKILEVTQPSTPVVAHVQNQASSTDLYSAIDSLNKQVQQLSNKMDKMATEIYQLKGNRFSRSHSRGQFNRNFISTPTTRRNPQPRG